MNDIFRPRHEPARTIYDAFQDEAAHRSGKEPAEWQGLEVMAVWFAAAKYASANGFKVPTVEEVIDAERLASGHVDYGAKWAYGVAEAMKLRNGKTMRFVCPEHGEVTPARIGYSFPLTGWCPVCDKQLTDTEGGIRVMTDDEAKKIRLSYTPNATPKEQL